MKNRNKPYFVKQDIGKSPFFKKNSSVLNHLDIELTERCNNNCVHCYINLPAEEAAVKEKELTTGRVKEIIKEAVSLGCLTVRFTGGEPLLREDFEELYVFARRSGLKVMIFTNATLITERTAGLFQKIPPLEKIEVSVYGMKKESYEKVSRSPGSFQAAWDGINLLLRHRIPFVVKGAFLPANRAEINEFEKWSAGIKWMEKPPSYSIFFDLHSRRDGRKNTLIKSLRPSPEEGMRVVSRRKNQYLKDMRGFCAKFMGPSGDRLFSCGSGIGGGCVDAYGYFQPCMMLRHPDTAYNLKTGSLKDALINFFPKLREAKASNPEYLSRCAKCFLKGLCEQCPAKSWAESGTLDTPVEYSCQIAHEQARFLGLIQDNEKAWEISTWKERVENFCEI